MLPLSTELTNLNHNNHTRPLTLSSSIFPEDEYLETVYCSIIDTIKDKADLLDQWRAFQKANHGDTYGTPSLVSMGLPKLKDAVITFNTCNGARLRNELVQAEVEKAIKAKADLGGYHYKAYIVRMDCHHHLRNVWIGALNTHLSKYLTKILKGDLNAIDF